MPSTPGPLPRRRDLRPAPAAPAAPVALLWVVIGAVLIAVSLAVMWGLNQGGAADDARADGAVPGENTVTPDADAALAGAPTTPAPSPEPEPTTTTDPAEGAVVAQGALDALPNASDCRNLYADAQVFHAYTNAVPGDAWPDLVSARRPASVLEDLREPCGDDYARRLADFIVTDPSAPELLVYTVRDHLGELPQHHPAPDDARELEMFRTADGNIGCTLTPDGAGCSVTTRSFPDPPECPDGAGGQGFSVALFTTEVYPCAGTITGGSTVLPDGASARVGDYACTVEGAGVRCWHTVSGTEFQLSATAFRG